MSPKLMTLPSVTPPFLGLFFGRIKAQHSGAKFGWMKICVAPKSRRVTAGTELTLASNVKYASGSIVAHKYKGPIASSESTRIEDLFSQTGNSSPRFCPRVLFDSLSPKPRRLPCSVSPRPSPNPTAAAVSLSKARPGTEATFSILGPAFSRLFHV